MTTIHKFPLHIVGTQIVNLPEAARILSIQFQGEYLFMWVWLCPTQPLEERLILCFGTGHTIPSEYRALQHLATIQHHDCVWHFFEKP